MANPAIPCAPTLDGVHLVGAATDEWRIRPKFGRRTVELDGNGGARQFLKWAGPAMPQIPVKYDVSFSWESLGTMRATVEELLSIPGIHELVLWRPEPLSWACDGQRSEFDLPWRLAPHVLPDAPEGLLLSKFAPTTKVGRTAAELDYFAKSQVDYDGGDPGAGEVWYLQGGKKFKLEEAPAAGAVVHAHVVPVFRVLEGEAEERRYTSPIAEPRTINFLEAAA